jgi:hypothetical protein
MRKRYALVSLVIVLLLVPMSGIFAQAASAVPDFKAMLKTIDERSNFTGRDFSAKIKMVSEDPEKEPRPGWPRPSVVTGMTVF